MARTLRISYDRLDNKPGAATILIDGNTVCRLNDHETFEAEISGDDHIVTARIGLLPAFRGCIAAGSNDWTLAYKLKGLNIHGGGQFILYENLPQKSQEELLSILQAQREELMKTLTTEEDLKAAIQREGLADIDFAVGQPHGVTGSIRLNRLDDGSWELYQVGDRGIEWKDVYDDPQEAFYQTLLLLRMLKKN